jgi:Flp pilus assembly protein TadG
MKTFPAKHIRRVCRCEDGATAIEFAVIAPVLMLLVMGTLEMGLVLTAQGIMETATYSASRLGKTGYVAEDANQEETIRAEVARLGRLMMNPADIEVTSVSYGGFDKIGEPEPSTDTNGNGVIEAGEYTDVNGNGAYDQDQGAAGFGGAQQVVVYTSTYTWELFTPIVREFFGEDGAIEISARAVVKNEPF